MLSIKVPFLFENRVGNVICGHRLCTINRSKKSQYIIFSCIFSRFMLVSTAKIMLAFCLSIHSRTGVNSSITSLRMSLPGFGGRFSPSLPLLKQLHWLPVNYRIKFKLSTLTYRALAIHQPPYLASLLHFSNVPRQLRSSTSQQLSIPRTKLNLGKRAFSVAAPIIWNELPTTLKSCESLASFRKNLKTYFFKIAFPP